MIRMNYASTLTTAQFLEDSALSLNADQIVHTVHILLMQILPWLDVLLILTLQQ